MADLVISGERWNDRSIYKMSRKVGRLKKYADGVELPRPVSLRLLCPPADVHVNSARTDSCMSGLDSWSDSTSSSDGEYVAIEGFLAAVLQAAYLT